MQVKNKTYSVEVGPLFFQKKIFNCIYYQNIYDCNITCYFNWLTDFVLFDVPKKRNSHTKH